MTTTPVRKKYKGETYRSIRALYRAHAKPGMVNRSTFAKRIADGWSVSKAFNTPPSHNCNPEGRRATRKPTTKVRKKPVNHKNLLSTKW